MIALRRTRPANATGRATTMIRPRCNTPRRNTQQLLNYRRVSRQAGGGADKRSWRDFFQVHPAADVFPLMPQDELRKLAANIERNGLKVPIQTRAVAGESRPYVIDGRNRLDACELLGWQIIDGNGNWHGALALVPNTKPKVEHLVDRTHAQIIAEIRAYNIERRHLTKAQVVEMIEATVRMTSPSMARSFSPTFGKKGGSTKDEHKAVVTTQAARVGISKRTVERVLSKAEPTPRRVKGKGSLKRSNLAGVFGEPFQIEVWRRFCLMLKTVAHNRHKDVRSYLLKQLGGSH